MMVFIRGAGSGLLRVSSVGGAVEPLTAVGEGERGHLLGDVLPDGRAVLMTVRGTGIAVAPLDTGSHRVLLEGSDPLQGTDPRYLATGHITFTRGDALWAVRFDAKKLEVVGSPFPVLESAAERRGNGQLAVSDNGTLAYAPADSATSQMIWFDRNGVELGRLGGTGTRAPIALAPDDSRAAFLWDGPRGSRPGIWIIDVEQGVPTLVVPSQRVTDPDGARLAYVRALLGRVFTRRASGGDETVLFETDDGRPTWVEDWSGPAQALAVLLSTGDQQEGAVIPLTGDRTPIVFDSAADLDGLHFSPDGQWIAYNAGHTGQAEVFVTPNPPTGERVQVTGQGGVQPTWRADGRELCFLAPDGRLMSVEFDTTNGSVRGVPTPLFQTGITVFTQYDQYAVSRDGQRFLIASAEGDSSLMIVLNWHQELLEREPVD